MDMIRTKEYYITSGNFQYKRANLSYYNLKHRIISENKKHDSGVIEVTGDITEINRWWEFNK